MAVRISASNPGIGNKRVGGTDTRYMITGGGAIPPGVVGTPVWMDHLLWDDNKLWID